MYDESDLAVIFEVAELIGSFSIWSYFSSLLTRPDK